MIIGIPKEIKNHEYRIGITPDAVKKFIENKHSVLIESGAGIASGFSDTDFVTAGAVVTYDRQDIWNISDIIVKVKEPMSHEFLFLSQGWPFFNEEAVIFSFFHFPANLSLEEVIRERKIKTIPYENIQLGDGSRPILRAMSKIAAEVAVDAAAHYLRRENSGKGKLLKDSTAVVIGCKGSLGKIAVDLLKKRGCDVVGFDKSVILVPYRSEETDERFCDSSKYLIENKILSYTDVIICAAANKGEGAPKIITREMLKLMQPGSVIIDPSIDEGGCCETSRPTTHDNPIYIEEGIIHYCVANMPGVVPCSSTPALVEETFPYVLEVANRGWNAAIKENEILARATIIT